MIALLKDQIDECHNGLARIQARINDFTSINDPGASRISAELARIRELTARCMLVKLTGTKSMVPHNFYPKKAAA